MDTNGAVITREQRKDFLEAGSHEEKGQQTEIGAVLGYKGPIRIHGSCAIRHIGDAGDSLAVGRESEEHVGIGDE